MESHKGINERYQVNIEKHNRVLFGWNGCKHGYSTAEMFVWKFSPTISWDHKVLPTCGGLPLAELTPANPAITEDRSG